MIWIIFLLIVYIIFLECRIYIHQQTMHDLLEEIQEEFDKLTEERNNKNDI